MVHVKAVEGVAKPNILSVNRLASMLKTDVEKLVELAAKAESHYLPFESPGRERYFQRRQPKSRLIDNPSQQLKKIQDRIHRQLLRPICFPPHIFGAVPKRSVLDNAEHHMGASLLVTIDVRKCFPSITNKQVYHVWRNVLGCSPPVAALLTRLTTFQRRLPQGAPTSPLIANLFIWSIDAPIREACAARGLIYSTFIDDLAFSGARAREMIQIAASVLAEHALRISHKKIKIMGPQEIKLLTGTRLGKLQARASKDKISRVRSGIHKLKIGLVPKEERQVYVDSLIGQLRYIEQLSSRDGLKCAGELTKCKIDEMSSDAKRFLKARSLPQNVPVS
jgi:Reverse transcriptase (RNA-dependent DNA polymerase)